MNYKKAKEILGDRTRFELRCMEKQYSIYPELNSDSENEKLRAVSVLLRSKR